MKKTRWGIISTAQIAKKQLIPAIQRSKNVVVAAIASRSDKVIGVADELNIPKAYKSYEDLLKDPDIDVVYIPLPNHLHKEWIVKAAEAGKHVLCEKPATLTAEEAKEAAAVCEKNNVKFMEAFMYQFHPQHQRVRDIIASGEIGDVKLMRANFSFYLDPASQNIRLNSDMGGGSIYDIGCYCIHSIRNIIQAEPAEVRVDAEIDPVHRVDTTAVGYMELDNGVKAVFDCSFHASFSNVYEVVGTKGSIRAPRAYRPDRQGGEGLIIVEKENEQRIESIVADQYALQVEHFSDAVLHGKNPSYTSENMIQNMTVIEACYESIKHGKKISLK